MNTGAARHADQPGARKIPIRRIGVGLVQNLAGMPIMFPPPFIEVVVNAVQAGDLAWLPGGQHTVAQQHRTRTGFAFMPSLPGVRHLTAAIQLNLLYVLDMNPSMATKPVLMSGPDD